MYISQHKQLIVFQDCFGILYGFARERVKRHFFHFKYCCMQLVALKLQVEWAWFNSWDTEMVWTMHIVYYICLVYKAFTVGEEKLVTHWKLYPVDW